MKHVSGYSGHRPQFWERSPRQHRRNQRKCRDSVSLPPLEGRLQTENCSAVNHDFGGIIGRGGQSGKALPPPSASAAVPTAAKICGASRGRTVKDNFVNHVVEKCGPAVVRIDTEKQQSQQSQMESDIFSFFFGVRPDQANRKVEGHGSGFCVESSGIVLTNAHVVQGQDRIFVTFPDGMRLEATVLGLDEVIDLAALQVAPGGRSLPSIKLGSSQALRAGDWAIACGTPFGLNNSCTLGIISNLDRSTGEAGWDWMRHPLIQTDAAVNRGNSGGPLLNEVGEAIGMVSMRALFGEGIAFAIPIDSIKHCLPSLLKRSDVSHAYLGIKLGSTLDGRRGVAIQMILDGTPAKEAGLQDGDVIEEFDGRQLTQIEDLQNFVRGLAAGTAVKLKVRHADGKSSRKTVVAGDVRRLKELRAKSRSQPMQTIVIMPQKINKSRPVAARVE
eukprot:TRINITY_DN44317_c0_g1_i1.p1 TRINITY_DN44317_c0_g1~~TRINITY_DN44317_c0_g1_i1.p1  ORF type:complete len:445 (-),score=44.96 TRINITY_DN44317_c0_g1_i1:391-1725(-)